MSVGGDSTLGSVLAGLGPLVLRALCQPLGSHVTAGLPVLLDTAEGVTAPAGSLLLAVGCRPGSTVTGQAIQAASNSGLAAVVIKSYGDETGPAIAAAQSAGIALLLVDDSVPWTHLHLMLSAGVAGERRRGDEESVSSVLGGDLFALANAVAAMVGGAIAIEDLHQQVLAYSNVPGQPIDEVRQAGILGRRVPAEFRLVDLYERVRRSEAVQRVELVGLRPRLAVAIRAGDEPIGSIWAVEGDSGFTADAEPALADAARLASLHILKLRTSADLDRAARAGALRAVLLGRRGPFGDALPSIADHELTVVAFQIVGTADDPDGTLLARTADLITVFCESLHRKAACLTLSETVYALLPTRVTDRTVLPALVERVLSRAAESLRVPLRAGIGSSARSLDAVVQSRQDADLVLQVLAERGNLPAIAAIADVRSRTILLQLQEIIANDPRLSLEVLDQMAAYDADKGSQYLATLRAYLDASGDVPTASAQLFLHQNTFRHRMRRVAEIFGVDLDDPDERLALWLLLRTRGR